MSTFLCQCRRPKPRPDGKGGKVCVECHGKVWEQKKEAGAAKSDDTMPADEVQREITRLRRLINESLDRIQVLTSRHAS